MKRSNRLEKKEINVIRHSAGRVMGYAIYATRQNL
jgi:hypothetical protein